MTTRPNPLTAPEPRRAAARAMLKAVGFNDADLEKPLIGVANTWIEIGPCNYHLRDLAVHVKEGIRAAGGTPMEFNTVSISDGITMNTGGHEDVAREPRGDDRLHRARRARQRVRRPHRARGLRQDDSGGRDGAGAAEYAGPRALRRLDRARTVARQGRHHSGRVRSGRRAGGGEDDAAGSAVARVGRVSGRRRVRGTVHREHDGDRRGVSRHRGARHRQRAGDASRQGRRGARGGRARDGSREERPQAARHHDARGARERDRVGRRDRRVDQRRAAPAGHRARSRRGAVARRFRPDQRADAGVRRPEAVGALRRQRPVCRRRQRRWSRSGCSNAKLLDRVREDRHRQDDRRRSGAGQRNAGQEVVQPARQADQADRRPDDPLTAISRRKARCSRSSGNAHLRHRGPARVFDSEEAAFDAVQSQSIKPNDVVVIRYEGPSGGPGHARDALGDLGDRRAGARRQGRAHHRRTVLGREPRLHRRPHRARGGARRADRARAATATSSCSTRTSASSRWSSATKNCRSGRRSGRRRRRVTRRA